MIKIRRLNLGISYNSPHNILGFVTHLYLHEYIRVEDSEALRVESLFRFSIAIDVS